VHRILKEVLRTSAEKIDGEVPVGTSASPQNRHPEGSGAQSHPERSGTTSEANRSAQSKDPYLLNNRSAAPPSPWSKRRDRESHQHALDPLRGPIPLEELHTIADESSQSERRADEAERGLMEWKKMKFMERRIGENFDGLIISVTKFGFFVELTDLFVEGLVPLNTLDDDRYTFHEDTRQIIGQRSRKTYSLGGRIRVLVDRIDPVEKKIQFAVFEDRPQRATSRKRK